VRPPAEVGESAVGIEGDRPVLQVADQLAFVGVALFGEVPERVGLRDLGAHQRLLLTCELRHLGLDAGQVGFGDGDGGIHVVVESVFDGGADTEADARIEGLERLGQQMRRRVPESVFALGIVPFEEFDSRILLDGTLEIDDLSVYRCGQRVGS
jgi:hypothetical protein